MLCVPRVLTTWCAWAKTIGNISRRGDGTDALASTAVIWMVKSLAMVGCKTVTVAVTTPGRTETPIRMPMVGTLAWAVTAWAVTPVDERVTPTGTAAVAGTVVRLTALPAWALTWICGTPADAATRTRDTSVPA